MAKYTHEEWLAELKNRFGEDNLKWSFVCPACGKVSTLQEFKDAGAEPNDSYQGCIGRHNGKGVDGMKVKSDVAPEHGCNWAAYGLFGTLGKGDTIVTAEGKEVDVFAMADPPNP